MLKIIIIPSTIIIFLLSCSTEKEKDINSKIIDPNSPIVSDSIKKLNEVKINLLPIDSIYIKEHFIFKGHLKQYLKWVDNEGTHVVFTCETGVYHTDINEEEEIYKQNAEIFCFHYLKKSNEFSKNWSIYDYSKDCPVDAMAKFCENSLEVTDLNKNGVPEIWTVYRIACRGDVSPSNLKLIMYEGNKKYKMQGHSRVELNENEKYGGEITIIKNLNEQRVFIDFAKKKWAQNIKDTFI